MTPARTPSHGREHMRRAPLSRAYAALLLIAALPLASGCATVKGAGKDISSVGQAGEDAINGK